MSDRQSNGDLSLVPYSIRENSEVVLRRNNALVVYDTTSGQLVLRGPPADSNLKRTKCLLCNRPYGDDAQEHERARQPSHTSAETEFVSPDYFRMLSESSPNTPSASRPQSPRRRLVRPIESAERGTPPPPPPLTDAEFGGGTYGSPPSPSGISSTAFSQGYFNRFFVEEGELGRGGKGVVLLVKHVLDGVFLGQYACKRVPVGDDHEWLKKVLVEVQLLQHFSHQNLVSYHHVWLESVQLTRFGPPVPCAFMLQQYCNAGDLHNYIYGPKPSTSPEELKDRARRRSKGRMDPPQGLRSARHLSFEEIYSFFRGITSGLNHLHIKGFIHRDLKPSNCLLHQIGNETRVLVSDFGEAQSENAARRSTGATGTISYCAPEVLQQQFPSGPFGEFTTKSDIFSLGMILYVMCFGRLPYDNADILNEENEDLDQLRQEIGGWSGFDDDVRIRTDLPEKLYRFLKKLLSLDPLTRPSAEDILRGISTGSGLGDAPLAMNQNPPGLFEDLRKSSRISALDSPSPGAVTGSRQPPQGSAASEFARQGSSSLRSSSTSTERQGQPPSYHEPSERDASPGSKLILRKNVTSSAPTSPRSFPSSPPPQHLLPPAPTNPRVASLLSSASFLNAVKVALFMLKVFSVSTPCSPLAANSWIFHSLISLAALDFALGHARPRSSLLLLIIHIIALIGAIRMHVLCASPGAYSYGQFWNA
ncbi:MAG: hypothetical protein M1825_005261 [Sarcosagium campestre]|nr:MAG: hypothetical protein M1825_005261 [Sarcosagium campestre]